MRWTPSNVEGTAHVERTARGHAGIEVFHGTGTSFVDKGIRAGWAYRYSVTFVDEAGNSSRTISALALPKVIALGGPDAPRTDGPPVLQLPHVAGASYYHVQLFRRRTRILAAWPLRPELRLHAKWKWRGRTYRLTPGRYTWYAWAGLGRRSATRYRALGRAEFIIGH